MPSAGFVIGAGSWLAGSDGHGFTVMFPLVGTLGGPRLSRATIALTRGSFCPSKETPAAPKECPASPMWFPCNSPAKSGHACDVKTAGAARSEPDHLLAMAPLAAVVRLAAPTTVVMVVPAVSNILYTYFFSRLGVGAIGAVSLVFPVSPLSITATGGCSAGS